LTLARSSGIQERMLAWHYRSRHPSLAALSNEECYAGRLLLPPSPFVQTAEFGLLGAILASPLALPAFRPSSATPSTI
jgi:hypothetical protein